MQKHWRNHLTDSLKHLPGPFKKAVPVEAKIALYKILAGKREQEMPLANGTRFAFRADHAYWAAQGNRVGQYEPEMRWVAEQFFSPSTLFIDGGANIGYWSSYATARIPNPRQILAVEANEALLEGLQRNRQLNQDGFTILTHALWEKPGETLTFNVCHNDVSSTLEKEEASKVMRQKAVVTSNIDSLYASSKKRCPQIDNVVIKLDVEGSEAAVLKGAEALLQEQRNVAFVFEDHGKHIQTENVAAFLKRGLAVYYIEAGRQQAAAQRIDTVQAAQALKTDARKGYNFVACPPESDFAARLQQLTQKPERWTMPDVAARSAPEAGQPVMPR
jgi:FkbM family methyltransferase